jgi:hypothetical protein
MTNQTGGLYLRVEISISGSENVESKVEIACTE